MPLIKFEDVKKKQIKVTVDEKTPLAQSQVLSLPVPPPQKASDYLLADEAWVFAASRLIANYFATINLKLFKVKRLKNERQVEEVQEHESISLLHDVNPFMTFNDLTKLTSIYRDITGEAYWVTLRFGTEKIHQIWPLRPDWVTAQPTENGLVEKYWYGPNSANRVEYLAKDVIRFVEPNLVNPYRGRGIVQAGAKVIDIDTFSDDWNRVFFYNFAMPTAILSAKSGVTQPQIDKLALQFKTQFQGRDKAHKFAFLSGDWQIDKLSEGLKDLDFIEGKKYIRDEILAMFHISKANLGVVEDVNKANQEGTDRRFMAVVIKPRMMSFTAALNEFYLTNWPTEDLFFDFDNPVPRDRELDLKVYDNALKNGWMTINEVRAEENLTPAQGGDSIYLPLTLTPVASVVGKIQGLFGKKSEEQTGVIKLEVKRQKKEHEFMMPIPPKKMAQLKKEQMHADLFKLANMILREVKFKKDKAQSKDDASKEDAPKVPQFATLPVEKHEAFWKAMVAKTDVQEQKMVEVLRRLFAQQESGVLQLVEENGGKFAGRVREKAIFPNFGAEVKRWFTEILPFLRSIVFEKGREILELVGVNGELDLTNERLQSFLGEKALTMVRGLNETTREELRKQIAEGVAEEESIAQIKKRVENVFEDAIGRRAETIARTEVLRATNFATLEGYKQSGVVEQKQWLTAFDERTSPDCIMLNGETVPLDQDFPDTDEGGEVDQPPLHPACRCTVLPVFHENT